MQKDQITIVTGRQNNTIYVRVSKASKGEFGIVSRKTGFIEMGSLEEANALKEKLDSNELAAQFVGQPNQQGNYETKVLPVSVGETIEHGA